MMKEKKFYYKIDYRRNVEVIVHLKKKKKKKKNQVQW